MIPMDDVPWPRTCVICRERDAQGFTCEPCFKKMLAALRIPPEMLAPLADLQCPPRPDFISPEVWERMKIEATSFHAVSRHCEPAVRRLTQEGKLEIQERDGVLYARPTKPWEHMLEGIRSPVI